jgi:hypothetical protein
MAVQGTTTVNFGSGSDSAQVVITGQTSITTANIVSAEIMPAVTANNGVDEHWVEDLTCMAGNIVGGTGFTIYVKCNRGLAYGQFNVAWAWN